MRCSLLPKQMNFVTWDLFREIDCLLPATTEDAMGLALGYCTNIDNTLRLTAQKATVVSTTLLIYFRGKELFFTIKEYTLKDS